MRTKTWVGLSVRVISLALTLPSSLPWKALKVMDIFLMDLVDERAEARGIYLDRI